MIPAEAVEAAMNAWLERSGKPGAWSLEEEVRAALEAAAPYIRATAWDGHGRTIPTPTLTTTTPTGASHEHHRVPGSTDPL